MIARPKTVWWLLRRSVVAAQRNGAFGTAKAAAYSGLLSFIPVLTALATLLVEVRAEEMSRRIARYLFIAVPPGTEELVLNSFRARERPFHLLVLATLLSIWAASGVMATLMEGFQAAYHLPGGRPFLKQRGMSILLVLTAATPVLAASALLVVGDEVQRWAMPALGIVPAGATIRGGVLLVADLVRHSVAFGAIVLCAAGLYYWGPNRRQQWRQVWPGAVLATGLWLAATMCFAWYVRNIAHYNILYGSIGAVIALSVWMYVLAVIALIGCEYNAERERFTRLGHTRKL